MVENTARNPSPWLIRAVSSSQYPSVPDFFKQSQCGFSSQENPRRLLRCPRRTAAPLLVRSKWSTLPSALLGRLVAYGPRFLPPRSSNLKASANASMRVDFPEPFSPTRNVTGEVKLSPTSANSATQGTVYVQVSWLAGRNRSGMYARRTSIEDFFLPIGSAAARGDAVVHWCTAWTAGWWTLGIALAGGTIFFSGGSQTHAGAHLPVIMESRERISSIFGTVTISPKGVV